MKLSVVVDGLMVCHVTPRAGVWIETKKFDLGILCFNVTPRAGVWIETVEPDNEARVKKKSPPVRGCGLKPDPVFTS